MSDRLALNDRRAEKAVEMTAVVKQFGAFRALDKISLVAGWGEKLVICGPSGSGKSTLIRCLNGLERHDSGHIVIDGIELSADLRALARVRREVGMVFQQFNLFPHLTILENCALAPREVRGTDREAANALALSYLERVHIADQADKKPAQLSGGQQQRAAIARALAMEPRIMLFDEPTSSLDPEMVKEVLDVIADLATAGMTMICVTHEMGFARKIADRVVFMDKGRIVEEAEPDAFFDNPQHARTRKFLGQLLY